MGREERKAMTQENSSACVGRPNSGRSTDWRRHKRFLRHNSGNGNRPTGKLVREIIFAEIRPLKQFIFLDQENLFTFEVENSRSSLTGF